MRQAESSVPMKYVYAIALRFFCDQLRKYSIDGRGRTPKHHGTVVLKGCLQFSTRSP
jgi:hypothetical protein